MIKLKINKKLTSKQYYTEQFPLSLGQKKYSIHTLTCLEKNNQLFISSYFFNFCVFFNFII